MRRLFRSLPMPLGAGAGVVVDQLFGEPPSTHHPLVEFGRVMKTYERGGYRDARGPGVLHALVGTGLGVGSGALLRSTTLATALAVGGKSLRHAANDVSNALREGDIEKARTLLPTLVGRDPSDLDETEISRAVVESVAENTVDAIIAPAFWAAITGARGALGYRAVNTMDAMVGHHSRRYEHYGWASARLDDLANWIPARLTAALVLLVRPLAAKEVVLAVTTQAKEHPSPNAGVSEAAFAAALGLTLGGRNVYGERVEHRPLLGRGRRTEASDIPAAIRLSRDVTIALVTVLVLIGARIGWTRR
jgi:adenosylcobinamide-phosphate synthase